MGCRWRDPARLTNMEENEHSNSESTALSATGAYVIVLPVQVVIYQITEQDLDYFASGMRSVFTGFASTFLTIAISVGVSLALSSDISVPLKVGMLSTVIATAVVGLVFGGFAV